MYKSGYKTKYLFLSLVFALGLLFIPGCGEDSGNDASGGDNSPPVASDQSVSAVMNTAVDITLGASDPDEDALTWHIDIGPLHGALTGDGQVRTYTPETGFTGEDSFTFHVNDNELGSNIATVSITITPDEAAKEITSFIFYAAGNETLSSDVTGDIDIDGFAISATVPFGTVVTALIPTIEITGQSVSPESGTAANFTDTVIYTVTASDSTTQDYTVTVNIALSDAKAITSFIFYEDGNDALSSDVTATIEGFSISAAVPFGTIVTALIPTIEITGQSVSPESGTDADFTNAVTYMVTAADSTTQEYTVTVSIDGRVCWYVDIDATVGGNGTSWENAFTHPQDGVDAAATGEYIWVAKGEYIRKDSTDVLLTMKEGVMIYGGFDGSETSLDERSLKDHIVTLNGSSEVYHVVVGADDARLDGFVITGGVADGGGDDNNGGGMYNVDCSPIVANCSFIDNSTDNGHGGGMYNSGASPEIINCVFLNNSANFSSKAPPSVNGGGIASCENSSPTVTNSTFCYNSAFICGGAVYNDSGSTITVTNSILWGNTADTGAQIYGQATVTYSDVEGDYTGEGNINNDPTFVSLDDLHLQPTSPCIDVANDSAASETDIEGNPRIDAPGPGSAISDMGAYEYQAD